MTDNQTGFCFIYGAVKWVVRDTQWDTKGNFCLLCCFKNVYSQTKKRSKKKIIKIHTCDYCRVICHNFSNRMSSMQIVDIPKQFHDHNITKKIFFFFSMVYNILCIIKDSTKKQWVIFCNNWFIKRENVIYLKNWSKWNPFTLLFLLNIFSNMVESDTLIECIRDKS